MKKLLTLLFTLCITLIGYNAAFAVCNSNSMGAEDFDVYPTFNLQYRDLNNNVAGTGAVNGQSVTVNNLRSYEFLDIIFSLNLVNHYVTFNGAFTITNQTPNSFSTEAFLQTISAPHILFTTEVHPDGIRDGACHFTSLNLNDTSQFVVDAQTGGDRFYYQSISWSVECYVGDDTDHTHFRGLRFDYLQNFINPNTSINGNVFFAAYIVPQYQHYNNPYDYQLCQILEGIDNQSSTDASTITNQLVQSTQDLITNDNSNTQQIIDNQNNNTQQIVDQLTDESCSQVACPNLFHPVQRIGSGSLLYGDSYLEYNVSARYGYDWTWNFNHLLTLERNKTYYYNIICNSEGSNLMSVRFGGLGNYTDWLPCGTGSFTWTSTVTDVSSINVKSTYNSTANYSTHIDFYVSDQQGDFCVYGSSFEVCSGSNKLDNISNSINDVNDTLNDSDTSDASVSFEEFMSNFSQSDFGFSDFVKIPITVLQTINSSTCTPLSLPLPFLNRTIDLPCYQPIFANYYGAVYYLTQTVYHAIIGYYCCYTVYKIIQDILDPNNDKIKILDL